MATQAHGSNTLQDLIWEDGIGAPLSLKLSLLEIITNNFSDEQIIGTGAYGTVYKGVLGDNIVAVKKFYSFHTIEDEIFQREVDCLMRIRHHNIVWFVGYCAETQMKIVQEGRKNIFAETREKLLCFEYLRNGSLHKHLTGKPCGLRWNICYQIIKGICLGLHYLHERHIIHLDLKPDNILLDDDMVPKIADFGLSRLLDEDKSRAITKNKLGTRRYMAPEYIDNGEISIKSDIYSLGVIIKHMVMGRNTEAMIDDVLQTWKIRLEKELPQTSQVPLEIRNRQIKACIEISESCTEFKPGKRPTIEDILRRLEKAEAEGRSVTSPTPSLERIKSLSMLMKALQSMDGSKAMVPVSSLQAWHDGTRDTNPDKVSYWLDTRSGPKCFMLSSRSLQIEWGDSPGYWTWINRSDSRFAECAELLNVYFLAVTGEILTEELSLGSPYSVYLVYKLASDAAGLKGSQTSSVRLYGQRIVATSRVSVDPTGRVAAGVARPVASAKHDGWMELKLAEFAPNDKLLLNERKVIVDFREENTGVRKSGLIIEGMEFRPSD